jgi:hypothetical protein
MFPLNGIAPANLWRAFFFGAGLAALARGAAPAGAPPELAQVGKPGAEEAARLLDQFRRAGVAGEFFFEIDFHTLPRRGEERVFKGRLWGGRVAQGAAFRVEVTDASGVTHRLLVQNGGPSAVWRVIDGRVVQLDAAASCAPLVAGVEVSAFDLQMPFLYWPEATLEKIARVFGSRPAYAYLFRAPPDFPVQNLGIAAARAYLDTQFNALMQTELIGSTGRIVKTFALVSLKKVGEQYIPKQAEYRNEITRDKTRIQVTGAALNLRLPASTFEVNSLAAPLEPPPAAQLVRIDP